MAQVIKELAMGCIDTGFIMVSTPPLTYPDLSELPNDTFNVCLNRVSCVTLTTLRSAP